MVEAVVKRARTCIGCMSSQEKTELMRIVRTPDGSVRFDGTGRVPGRGAYVCSEECLAKALKSKKLQRALKCAVSEEDATRILSDCRECASMTRDDRR